MVWAAKGCCGCRLRSDAIGNCENPIHIAQHRLLDELALDHDQSGICFFEGVRKKKLGQDSCSSAIPLMTLF